MGGHGKRLGYGDVGCSRRIQNIAFTTGSPCDTADLRTKTGRSVLDAIVLLDGEHSLPASDLLHKQTIHRCWGTPPAPQPSVPERSLRPVPRLRSNGVLILRAGSWGRAGTWDAMRVKVVMLGGRTWIAGVVGVHHQQQNNGQYTARRVTTAPRVTSCRGPRCSKIPPTDSRAR